MDKNPKKERFISTAIKLLSERGYKAMTMRDLASSLECDKSNIYNYINSKQALLDELLFEIADKFHSGISDIESSSYSAIDKLKAVIRLHVTMTFDNPYKMNIHANEWRFLEADRKKIFVKRRRTYEDKISSIVQQGINAELFKTGDKEFLKNCILSSIRWLYTWKSKDKKYQNPVEIEKQITEFILNGICEQV